MVDIDATAAQKVLINLIEKNPKDSVKTKIGSMIQSYEEYRRDLSVTEKQTLQSTLSDLKSSNSNIRRKAVNIIGKFKHVSVVEFLHIALKDEDGIVRTTVAEALGKFGDNRSALPLIEMLENDSYSHARAAAARALGQCATIGDERVIDVLLKGHNDKYSAVRKWCSRSVKQLRR